MRKIIHCDCDCFYASIEIRDNPALRGKAVAVGGSPSRRGVIATCNYEARRYGVRSAMASAQALKLCPELIIVKPDFDKYKQASRQIHQIFRDYTELIEPLSLDEAYLDVSASSACRGSATLMAQEIRQRVRETLGITLSAGVAPNKFLAKIASDWNKPDGQFVITPDQVEAFVQALPVAKLHGVGRVTARKLKALGVERCADLRRFSVLELVERFGSFGTRLYELCRGLDERPVKASRVRKSLSVEHTYAQDLPDLAACRAELPALCEQLNQRLARLQDPYRIHKAFVKLKFNDFTLTTMECAALQPELGLFVKLAAAAFERGQRPVRLMGVGVRFHEPQALQQLELFS